MSSVKIPDDPDRGYVAPVFRNTPAIIDMHHKPRFGHTNDISALYSGTSSEQKDYVVGASCISILILSILLVWTIVLVVLKCLGRKVGCAAGIPPKVPNKSTATKEVADEGQDAKSPPEGAIDSEEFVADAEHIEGGNGAEHDTGGESAEVSVDSEKGKVEEHADGDNMSIRQYEREVRRVRRLVISARIVFLIAAIVVFAATILLVVDGFTSLKGSFSATFASFEQIESICLAGINATNSYLNSTRLAVQVFDDLRKDLDGTTCADLSVMEDVTLGTVVNMLFNFTTDIAVPMVQNVQHDLFEIMDVTDSLSRSLHRMEGALLVALAAALVVIVMTIIFVLGVILAWWEGSPKPFRCLQTYTVLPIFILFMVLSAVFSAVFAMGALVSSDFCFDSPDADVVALLEEYKYLFSSAVVYELLLYYVKGCPVSSVQLQLSTFIQGGMAALESLAQISDSIAQVPPDQWNSLCGTDQPVVVGAARLGEIQIRTYLQALISIRTIFSCASFNPIYVNLMYDAACYNGINALARMFASQLAIAIAGMTMVTLRVSWRQVEEEDETTREKSCSRCMKCCG